MATYLYRPNHPLADKSGMVEKNDFYTYKYMIEPDNRMMVGNKVVKIYYNSDEMPPTRHMINNRMYTSKKKFRDETKARGCIEVGNETKTMLKPRVPVRLDRRQRRNDIKRAIHDLRNAK